MRKDVKFGLTIGGILVATLVVYVIVLSRNSSGSSKIAVAQPGPNDQDSAQAPDTDSTNRPDVASNSSSDQLDKTGTSAEAVTPPSTPDLSTPPATQPTASADSKIDWDSALNRGTVPTLSASTPPERTVTPMIDSPMLAAPRSDMALTRTATTPMIDPLSLPAPTTQPATAMRFVPADNTLSTGSTAVTAPLSVSTPTSTTPRTHRVTSGESPYSIAEDVYGNGMYYKKILAANPGVDPHRLRVGQLLNIPELSDTEKNPAPAASTDASAKVDSFSAYQVVSGDTLEKISRKLYGSANMIDKLYATNKTLIGPNEDVLKVGWVLKLPQPPTVASAMR